MEFKLSIKMDNTAFDIMPNREIGAILSDVITRLSAGLNEGKLQDINGNVVGQFEITHED